MSNHGACLLLPSLPTKVWPVDLHFCGSKRPFSYWVPPSLCNSRTACNAATRVTTRCDRCHTSMRKGELLTTESNHSCADDSCHFFDVGVQQVVIWNMFVFRSAQRQVLRSSSSTWQR